MNIQLQSINKNEYGYTVAYTTSNKEQTLMYTRNEIAELLEDQGIIECYAENEIDGLVLFMDGEGEQFNVFMDRFTDDMWRGLLASIEMGKTINAVL